MTNNQALEDAKSQLQELTEAARTGAIIPVRLPGQLEAIMEAIVKAEEEAAEAARKQAAAGGGDVGAVRVENAEFMKTAVHELRTPMTSIRGYTDMLSNPAMAGELSEMQNQLLQVIRSNARRMEGLLSDMSYINKLRGGILIVNEKMDMFKNIAMMAEKATMPTAEELKRTLEFDIPQGLPLLNTDGEHFAHALAKLIENGLRYSDDETGKVTVTGTGDNGTLVVTVSDNGIGMTPEDKEKLGTLFFRSDHDTVRNYKGSGLGIPIAYGIIEALGGSIDVESAPDEGTTFTIRLKGMS